MKPSHTLSRASSWRAVFILALAASAGCAHAQLRLPSVGLPQIGNFDPLRLPSQVAGRELRDLPDVRAVRLEQVGRLLRQHRDVLEADPRGEAVVRREILAWAPSPAAVAAALAEGLSIARDGGAGELRTLVLRLPDGVDTGAVLARLRTLDPGGVYDFNHIYTGSAAAPLGEAAAAGRSDGAAGPATAAGPRVGLVDSGVDRTHAVFRDASITRWGCDGKDHPSAHGTAVAALMVGNAARFHGAAPQASLYAADIYCDSPTGGSADKIAAALAWLAQGKVAVINLSLVGPPNQALERMVGALQQRGHLLVAAVGNDGPAAPPLYPASYPGVVGVSAVDRDGKPLPEAARGPQVMFAAPGNNMVSAAIGMPAYRAVRGTSFAAPLVAAMLAGTLTHPDKARAPAAIAALAKQASRDDGATVSNATGYGIVGAAFRTDPASIR
jgi:hypothetical protein